MVAETIDRKRRFDALNTWITERGGWCTSLPGDALACRTDLPTELAQRGYELEAGPSGERILPAGRLENVTIEGSSRSTIRTAHAGIVKVMRYVFPL
jgi:hypothetical protein